MVGEDTIVLCRGYEGERRLVCRGDENKRELGSLKAVKARTLLCE